MFKLKKNKKIDEIKSYFVFWDYWRVSKKYSFCWHVQFSVVYILICKINSLLRKDLLIQNVATKRTLSQTCLNRQVCRHIHIKNYIFPEDAMADL